VCPHCRAHLNTTTVIGRQDTAEPPVEPGPKTVADAAALRDVIAGFAGSRAAGQLAAVFDAPVMRYLRAARPTAFLPVRNAVRHVSTATR
jgi:hypothetical protein